MEANIDDGTRHSYRLNQRRLIIYLHNKSKMKKGGGPFRILHNDLERELTEVEKKQSNEKAKTGDKKGKGGGKKAKACGKKVQDLLSEVAMRHLGKANAQYHPIKLEELSVSVFVMYLMSLSDVKNKEFMKSYGGHRSALTQLFTQCEVTPTADHLQQMKRAMSGLKNTSAKARGVKGKRLTEGKDPLPFEVYRALCQWMVEDEDTESVFGHCFLTLTWNLMCHSRNTVNVRIEHIGWEGDAMTIQFAHTKTDQEGDEASRKRHIYANPHMPEICAVTSFARFRLTFPGKDTGKLFEGKSQYDRFRKLLARIVKEHAADIRNMGIDPADIGVHSIRKGAATYCCNGTTAGVGFAAVCNRAGWSMGGVKDRYLQYEEAGDQVCGRTVAGLDVNSHKFAVSAPFFIAR